MATTYDALTNTKLKGETTEAGTIGELAQQAAIPSVLEAGEIYGTRSDDGRIIFTDTDSYADRPRRKQNTSIKVSDAQSFATYLDKHGIADETEIYARRNQNSIQAVINAGTSEEAGWGDHTVNLVLSHTKEWAEWAALSGKFSTQETFAEFIEDHAKDIVSPASAEVLEIASSLQVKRGAEFESGIRLSDGNVQFGYRETTNATAGRAGQLTIPETFELALKPYEGGDPYKVTAKFRYRLREGHLSLGIKIERLDDILRESFQDIADQVAEHAQGIGATFYNAA